MALWLVAAHGVVQQGVFELVGLTVVWGGRWRARRSMGGPNSVRVAGLVLHFHGGLDLSGGTRRQIILTALEVYGDLNRGTELGLNGDRCEKAMRECRGSRVSRNCPTYDSLFRTQRLVEIGLLTVMWNYGILTVLRAYGTLTEFGIGTAVFKD